MTTSLSIVSVALLCGVGSWLGNVLDRRDKRRAERARADWEVRRAERQLHNLASRTFIEMVDAARDKHGLGQPWQ